MNPAIYYRNNIESSSASSSCTAYVHRGIDRLQKLHPLIADRLRSFNTDIMNTRNGENNQLAD